MSPRAMFCHLAEVVSQVRKSASCRAVSCTSGSAERLASAEPNSIR
jgi:hypothetical protein